MLRSTSVMVKHAEMPEKPDKSMRQPTMVIKYGLKYVPKCVFEVGRNWLRAYYKMRIRLRHDDWSRGSGSWRKNNGNGSGEPLYQHPWYCASNWSFEKRSPACALERRITSLPVQHLLLEDYGRREEFSQWIIIEHCNPNWFILYTD